MTATIEQYLLSKLMEEAGEVVQAASKSLRFGLETHFSKKPDTNAGELASEVEDLLVAWSVLRDIGRVPNWPEQDRVAHRARKRERLLHYYYLSQKLGLVQPGLALLLGAQPTYEAPLEPCVIGQHCAHHGYVHGSEAEELRKRLEGLVEQYPEGVTADKLLWVLRTVDARDSASYVRANPALEPWYGE